MHTRLLELTIADVCETMKLCNHSTTGLEETLNEVDDGSGWIVQVSKCRICSYEELDIMPASADSDNLECAICGNKAMQAKEDEEWE